MLLPEHLFRGYRRFRRARYAEEAALFRELAERQSPRTMIIGCVDSRVDSATIFAAAPGELHWLDKMSGDFMAVDAD